MNRYLVEYYERYFPTFAENTRTYHVVADDLLHVELKDGTCFMYDDMNITINRMPDDKYDMSEEEFRQMFAWRLGRVMRRMHITQGELADATGIHPVTISRYMNCTSTPSFYAVDRIAKALDISTDELRYV